MTTRIEKVELIKPITKAQSLIRELFELNLNSKALLNRIICLFYCPTSARGFPSERVHFLFVMWSGVHLLLVLRRWSCCPPGMATASTLLFPASCHVDSQWISRWTKWVLEGMMVTGKPRDAISSVASAFFVQVGTVTVENPQFSWIWGLEFHFSFF